MVKANLELLVSFKKVRIATRKEKKKNICIPLLKNM